MIIRAILGIVLGGALSAGALYAAGEYLGLKPAQFAMGALVDGTGADEGTEPADIEPGEPEGEMLDGEGPVDDRLPLPYGEGEAALWLADTLAGTGPYAASGDMGESVDLASLARLTADEPESVDGLVTTRRTAACSASHVVLVCNIEVFDTDQTGGASTEHLARYNFHLQSMEGGWQINPESVTVTYAG